MLQEAFGWKEDSIEVGDLATALRAHAISVEDEVGLDGLGMGPNGSIEKVK